MPLSPAAVSIRRRVLAVDDEPDVTRLIKWALERSGRFQVEIENSATRAVESARRFQPELIVLDVMMPDMDGADVATALRADAKLREIPVVFLTAVVSEPGWQTELGTDEAAIRMLPKPFTADELVKRIDEEFAAAKK
jgi:CheY-like chemotaxis protein